MQEVNCFKGISNKLYVFGFQPLDLVIAFFGGFFLHGFLSSLLIDFIYLVIAYIVLKKIRYRPDKYFTSIVMFFVSPSWMPLPENKEKK
ncbi:MAG: hypothetical protein QME68_00130 [Elusimicrobiota bacterium]|nr:hypothetical protein [Elusimicrobiota bacterium]